jgi:hypothetical protein
MISEKLKFHQLPTSIRVSFMFIFMVTLSAFLQNFTMKTGFQINENTTTFLMWYPVVFVLMAYKKITKHNLINYYIAIFLLILCPLYNIYEVLSLNEYRGKNEVILMWWPICNVVLQYIFVGLMYNSKNREFYDNSET